MSTYAAKLRQADGQSVLAFNSTNEVQISKSDGTVLKSIGNINDGSTTSAADSLAQPLTAAIVLKTTGADAEALTLADGVPGQIVNINLDTDGGGTGTLTPATATGWATIAFADAGDAATLMYVNDTVGWIILGCYGLTAQPTIAV